MALSWVRTLVSLSLVRQGTARAAKVPYARVISDSDNCDVLHPTMASLLRSAKSGSDWSDNELFAFNIRVANATIPAFFNITELPPPTVSATILNNMDKPDGPLMKDDRLFFQYMKLAEKSRSPESRVDDFAAFILRILNYDDEDRVICQRTEISFPMVGQRVDAKTDVCLMDELEFLLLVQEDKVSC